MLPIRLDETAVPELADTIKCLSIPPETPRTVASAVASKLSETLQRRPVTPNKPINNRRTVIWSFLTVLALLIPFAISPLRQFFLQSFYRDNEGIARVDAELAFRLKGIPHSIRRSRESTNPVAKGNILNSVFDIPEADWTSPLFPRYANTSILNLCYELTLAIPAQERANVESAYGLFKAMAKDAREKYNVHDMYKMHPDQLKEAEDTAEQYYKRIVELRPQWIDE